MGSGLNETLWLRADCMEWVIFAGSGVSTDGRGDPLGVRAEASYSHASYRIEQCAAPYDRSDAILALKRSLRARLEHLDSVLGLATIPTGEGVDPNDWLGKLEALGIIKKGMLRRLNRLRNAIEHDGAEPPDIDECKDYQEMMWYFLKVTTPYLRPPMDEELMPDDSDDPQNFTCYISYKPFALTVHGTFAEDYLSPAREQDWLEIVATSISAVKKSDSDYLRIIGSVRDPRSRSILLRSLFDKFV
ncbi:MAG: hypothetical protein ABSA02_43085 [Trebonia sp.]|jgi:hypothetical protein